ncbi:helix-turn-helix domain-containing protein [Rhizobium sp. BK377]|uniref:helix-turn-helix domain-containing protein n=1 Tax=Rhizobium sp. BK377 TaxID=2587058 RepID=UPI001613A8A5|nr:helix-turn-helix transcriptional regulator [Rhizobium sp. BK377]MBB3463058.1 transcriptional regulator with XRE-family HTH domain [Rhizobium sp. BK377]
METFSSNLKRRAEQLGISNAEVARRVGLTERRYGNYISGRREPDLATLVKISSVLVTPLDELLSSNLEKSQKSAKRKLQDRILSAAQALDEDDLKRLAIMVDALAASRA